MKKSTYKPGMVLILLMAALMLYGCKGKEEPKETLQPTASVTQTPEAVPAAGSEGTDTDRASGEEAKTEPAGYKMVKGTADVKLIDIYTEDFEDGKTDFTGRGAAKVQIVNDKAKDGTSSMYVTGRTAIWNGATVDLTSLLKVNQNYSIKAYVMYDKGPDKVEIDCKLEKNHGEYLNFAAASASKGEWTEITGNIVIPEGTTAVEVYFETAFAGGELIDFYVDSIAITKEEAVVDRGDIPALKDVYDGLFSVGVASTVNELTASHQELIKQQFNSLTPGNELKADSVLDYNTCISDPKYDDNPAVRFDSVKPLLDFAKENNIPMRGHTLIWHSQTPRWFFTVGYSKDANAPLVSKDLMLKRMENYIRQVLEYTQTNYPGVIYAWDVVNEAINPSDGEEGGYRSKDSLYYQIIGPEFVERAFEYARKYAGKDVKLFYNDYNTEEKAKVLAIYSLAKNLKDKGLIDGIGLQTHITIDSPSLVDIDASLSKYAELGLQLQFTELDMGMTVDTEEDYLRQAKRYKRLFTIIKSYDESGKADITNVTFWGLSDDTSWLSKPGQPSYPLLFDKYLLQKPAFWGVILSPDIPLY